MSAVLFGFVIVVASAVVPPAVYRVFSARRAARTARREAMLARISRGFPGLRARCTCECCTVPTETTDAFHLAVWETELSA